MSFELRCGDCLDPATGLVTLADKSVDCILADPPYSERVHSKTMRSSPGSPGKWGHGISQRRQLGFEPITTEQMEIVTKHAARVARRWVMFFCDLEIAHKWFAAGAASGLEYVRTGVWVKPGSTPQFTGDRPAPGCEGLAIMHPPGRKRWNGGGASAVWVNPPVRIGQDETGRHPSQKPEAIMEALVKDFTDPGETILDPFAGSGTTGVAAIRLGRRFIGWERDEKYHRIAARRLCAARELLRMPFVEGPPPPSQTPEDTPTSRRRVVVLLDGKEVEA